MKNLISSILFLSLILGSSINVNSQSWEKLAIGVLPVDYGVFSMKVVDENIIWAVAFDQSVTSPVPSNHVIKVLKTTDAGESWTIYDVDEAVGRISFDIEAFDSSTAFITTQDYNSGAGRGVFKTEDGGETWVEIHDDLSAGIWIRFFSKQEAIVINRGYMSFTLNGGTTWHSVSASNIPPFQNNEYTVITAGSNSCQVIGDYIWFGTSAGRVYRSKDKGVHWEAFQTSLGESALIQSIAFKDTLNGMAIDVGYEGTSICKTTDGGETWENITTNSDISFSNITYVPNSNGAFFGVTDWYTQESLRMSGYTIDFGQNWEFIENSTDFGPVQFLDANTGWASLGRATSTEDAAIFKWNGDIYSDINYLTVNIDCNVFPNPFVDDININSNNSLFTKYRIYTLEGKIVKSGYYRDNIDLAELKVGMYHLELLSEDKSLTKIIIKAN